MPSKKVDKSPPQRNTALARIKANRKALQLRTRGDDRGYSLEGLRLSALLSQVQALQAVQGLTELRPRDRNAKRRFAFSSDPLECVRQRQWLTFKADWLEALLEDTVAELEALEKHERALGAPGSEAAAGALEGGSGTSRRDDAKS